MTIPAVIYLILVGINLLLNAHLHGRPRTDYNFWDTAFSVAVAISLLWWGGFFN